MPFVRSMYMTYSLCHIIKLHPRLIEFMYNSLFAYWCGHQLSKTAQSCKFDFFFFVKWDLLPLFKILDLLPLSRNGWIPYGTYFFFSLFWLIWLRVEQTKILIKEVCPDILPYIQITFGYFTEKVWHTSQKHEKKNFGGNILV